MIEKSLMEENQNNESLVIGDNKQLRNSSELNNNNVIPEYGQEKASKLASKMIFQNDTKDDKRFREGMLELNRRLGKRQRTNFIGAMGTTVLSATAVVLTALSVVTMGVSAIAGAISLGIGAGMTVSDSYDSKSMKMALFDSYFKIPVVYDSEKKEWEKKNNRKLTAEEKARMRDLIRNRIAAREGYYSPRHAAKEIAGKFAQFLLTKAHDKNNKEEAKVYIAMIRGLGLKYRDDPSKEPLPKESDIIKKLCS